MPGNVDKTYKNFGRAVSTMRSAPFKKAVRDMESDPQVRDEAAENPEQFLENRNVQLPEDADVDIDPDNWSISFKIWGVTVTFSF